MTPRQRTLSLYLTGGALLCAAWLFGRSEPAAVIAASAPETPANAAAVDPQRAAPLVQVALLLDTSGSMDGLIEQAKSQLWRMVNELARARRNGQQPRVELALYEYGNTNASAERGWVRQIVAFTTELDRVSEALFALTTAGGDEWCGRTIDLAMKELEWSRDPTALKMIFVAGNEAFNQGPDDPYQVVKRAAAQGITVSTIYCGDSSSADAQGWKSGALLADGRFMTIDHHFQVADIAAPQDQALAVLGVELNQTYVPYGTEGRVAQARQKEQDDNSKRYGAANFGTRAASKASAQYYNPSWDLVDATKGGAVDLGQLDEAALPDELKNLSPEDRRAFIRAKQQKRDEIQAKIRALSAERDRFVAEARKQQAEGPTSLDAAMIEAVRSQATKRGFAFAE